MYASHFVFTTENKIRNSFLLFNWGSHKRRNNYKLIKNNILKLTKKKTASIRLNQFKF